MRTLAASVLALAAALVLTSCGGNNARASCAPAGAAADAELLRELGDQA